MNSSLLRALLCLPVSMCLQAITSTVTGRAAAQTFDPNLSLNVAMDQLALAQAYPNKSSYPRSTNPDGTIIRVTAGDWTSGFFPGSLWLMYERTKDIAWRTRAEQWTAGLQSQQYNTSTHDVGFILFSSFGQGYRLTGNQQYKTILLQGAKSLATRYNPIVGCIKSWNNANYHFPVIIDNMMNLELLFWATKASGDSSFYKIAVQHALTTITNHFRPDHSSYHLVDYDPNTGKVLAKLTYQGLNHLSDWARGQAWGLYGFTMCYRETKDTRFLDMAKKIADFYITHPNMPADLVPFWDFDAFDFRDASAASIASAALMELSQYVPEKRDVYYNFGINTLKTLSSTTYMAAKGTNNYFISRHCVGNKPKNYEVDQPLVYADYYFIEALLRHQKPSPIVMATGGNNRITLKWNVSTGAKYYSVLSSTTSGGPYTTIASTITGIQYTHSGLSAGKTYYYKVTPWNAMGAGEASKEASATTNRPPYVSMTSPANNSVFTAPATFTLKAAASDPDGTISNVKFYKGTSFLKAEYNSPYTCDISNLPAGTYTFTARGTDNQGAQSNAASITINVASAELITYKRP
ncbi:Ig-like domain-containing protein [Chitinophagaceae bacterium LB-8]|uniref:Ig-like domain-containing protein n=1 Tax=Paraflavisolibacter caeni TaxID=2982496 RepID=A0A9X2XTN6_9BACT|nr:Ig-like domain-containing protein [Paraflavisolibacter caeni]MCU7548176.1 Ig-like domain-containing protein [Paraflavisolibacter caeni]